MQTGQPVALKTGSLSVTGEKLYKPFSDFLIVLTFIFQTPKRCGPGFAVMNLEETIFAEARGRVFCFVVNFQVHHYFIFDYRRRKVKRFSASNEQIDISPCRHKTYENK